MPEKPAHASGYPSGHLEKVRQTCLYIATKLGDLADEMVVVGGLAPSLLIDQDHLPPGAERHVGTLDLDFGLGLAVLDASKYQAVVERLREAGFTPDKKDGKVVRQRWGFDVPKDERLTVEFLIPPSDSSDRPGSLRNLEGDFAAELKPYLRDASAQRALEILREDFTSPDRIGPQRAARFLEAPDEAAMAADVVAFVSRFLELSKA